MEKRQKRVGRPTKPAEGHQKKTLGIRATVDLANQLAREAERNDRSLSAEAELRLEQSFAREALLPELMELTFGAGIAGLLLILGRVMPEAGKSVSLQKNGFGGPDWMADRDAFKEAMIAAATVLEEFQPEGEATLATSARSAGDAFAKDRISKVVNEGAPYPYGEKDWIDLARRLLGPDLLNQSRHRREWAEESGRIVEARRKAQKEGGAK